MAKRLLLFLVFAFSHSLVALGGKNYYEILQVSEEASEDQIKRAYRKLALKYHPNKNAGNEEANMRFAEINNAYDVLSDREKRSIYNQNGEERLKRHASGGGRDAGVNIQDIFNNYDKEVVLYDEGEPIIDGEAGDLKFKILTAPHEQFRREGNYLHTIVSISLVQALVGFEKTIKHLDGHSVDIGSIRELPNPKRRGGSKVKGCLRT